MQVLVTGADGFIGRALCTRLAARGHVVVAGVHRGSNRSPARCAASHDAPAAGVSREVDVDFVRDVTADAWLPRLTGIDAVVNAVGLIREHGDATFARVHVEAPIALYDASAARGIAHFVQLSALGADAQSRSAYHRTKRMADEALHARLPRAWSAQPSLVFGAHGGSARLFMLLASLPVIPVPGHGESRVQPIHVDDLVLALCALLEGDGPGGTVALVGPRPLALRDWLVTLRQCLGLPRTHVVAVPWAAMRAAAALAEHFPGSLLDRDTLGMLARGNAADAGATAALLQRAPRDPAAFITAAEAPALRTTARLGWLLPLLRSAVAVVWIGTAIVSFGVFPVSESYALLARTGVPAALAPLFLYGAAGLDLAFGVGIFMLSGQRRRLLWRAQVVLIVLYSVLIAWRLPEFWVHPYAPMLKNVPLVAMLVLLDVLEPRA